MNHEKSDPGRFLRILTAWGSALVMMIACSAGPPDSDAPMQIDSEALEAGMTQALGRSEAMLDYFKTENPDPAGRDFPVSRINGAIARLDDPSHVQAATFESGAGSDSNHAYDMAPLASFDFDEPSGWGMELSRAEGVWEGGILRVTPARGGGLVSSRALSLDPRQISVVEVRMKSIESSAAVLAWTSRSDTEKFLGSENAGSNFSKGVGGIRIEVIPDGEFHTYQIDVTKALQRRIKSDDRIHGLFFRTSGEGEPVELDYLRIWPAWRKYAGESPGVSHELRNGELRPVLHVQTPSTLTFDLEVPEGPASLQFGMASLEADGDVHCDVKLETGTTGLTLAKVESGSTERWEDSTIPLPDDVSGSVKLSFLLQSSKPDIAFLSSPRIISSPQDRFNIILILEDTLRADHLSAYGHVRQTSPVKDRLASEGVLFEYAFSQATKTRPSCPSIMTAMYPTVTGVWTTSDMLHENFTTLPEILKHQGYSTAAFIQNLNAGPAAGLHQGFERAYLRSRVGKRPWEIYADVLFDWIAEQKDLNFFAYVHLLDPHAVYSPHEKDRHWWEEPEYEREPVPFHKGLDTSWADPPSVEGRRRRYDGEILQNDRELERLLHVLEEMGIRDDTLVVVISDHGEFLGEHDLWEHRPPSYRQVIHVPFIMHMPRILPGRVSIDDPVQMVDVLPTILELAGIEYDPRRFSGDSLVPYFAQNRDLSFENRLAISEEVYGETRASIGPWASVISRNSHFIHSRKFDSGSDASAGGTREERVDLRGYDYTRDPGQERPLTLDDLEYPVRERLVGFIEQHQQKNFMIWSEITGGETEFVEYDEDSLEQLRSLGYL